MKISRHSQPNPLRHKLPFPDSSYEKGPLTVYLILRVAVIIALVFAIIDQRWENVFTCLLVLVLFLVPSFLEHKLKIELPSALEIVILIFIFAAEILGEIEAFYLRFAFWDTMLHTINGFLCAAVGFSLVDILNRNGRIKFELSPLYLAICAFCFSMTIGVLWEFFEFFMDRVFFFDMQKDTVISSIHSVMLNPTGENIPLHLQRITETAVNGIQLPVNGYLDIGLYDTMKDLIVNFIGAVVFSFIGYFYVQNRGQGKFASGFVPTLRMENDNEEK